MFIQYQVLLPLELMSQVQFKCKLVRFQNSVWTTLLQVIEGNLGQGIFGHQSTGSQSLSITLVLGNPYFIFYLSLSFIQGYALKKQQHWLSPSPELRLQGKSSHIINLSFGRYRPSRTTNYLTCACTQTHLHNHTQLLSLRN